jgi:chromate transporter
MRAPSRKKSDLKAVISLFLKMGILSFGGPAAHTAMMEQEVVQKRKWIDKQHFLDLLGATNLIPGPNSSEMAMHIGHEKAGFMGLLFAGMAFIVPACLISGIFAWFYVSYGELPAVQPMIAGIKPAVLAIIAMAVFSLGKKAVKGPETAILGVLVLAAGIAGLSELTAMILAGIAGTTFFYFKNRQHKLNSIAPFIALPVLSLFSGISISGIFWIFLKIGSLLYGGGYVLFAFLDAELVQNGLLSRNELMDAVAVGQFTPGPILSTATFIGYIMAGIPGAIAATAGVFLPSFIFVAILNPLIPRLRKSKLAGNFLDSVNVASVAVMASVLFSMAIDTLQTWQTISICLAAFMYIILSKNYSSVFLVVGGAVAGFLLHLV